ncbi:ArdC family protein [Devosia sp. MC1541]|uniref:ArdC family protein n=1 Tax=Devosia sp. MC1541 TaxID=2725264 RepID=UPI0032C0FFAC
MPRFTAAPTALSLGRVPLPLKPSRSPWASRPLIKAARQAERPCQNKTSPNATFTPRSPARSSRRLNPPPGKPSLPWRHGGEPPHLPVNALTGSAYRGINIVNLWVIVEVQGYRFPVCGTYRKWAERGAQVRKGQKASMVWAATWPTASEPRPTLPRS